MAPPQIHPTAIIDLKAEIAPTARIGPFAVIESGVTIGEGCTIGPYVHIQGQTLLGANNQIGTGVTLGHAPQHTGYKGAPTRLVIGDNNVIREYASIHRAFHEGEATTIGNDCFIMGFSHVGHDCHVGNGVIIADTAMLAGHVSVGDRAFISGHTAIHQFCRIGRLAMLSAFSGIGQDIPPFMTVRGIPACIRGLNSVGLVRAGFSSQVRVELKRVFHSLYRSEKTVKSAIDDLDLNVLGPQARELVEFYSTSKRGVAAFERYRRGGKTPEPDEDGEGE